QGREDRAQLPPNLSIQLPPPSLRDKDDVILAFPARVRQALPVRFCHPVLLRICQQAILGGLYSRTAQSSSCLTGEPVASLLLFSYEKFWSGERSILENFCC